MFILMDKTEKAPSGCADDRRIPGCRRMSASPLTLIYLSVLQRLLICMRIQHKGGLL